jgi:putative flavoprotein involved in K+ transport
VFDWIWPLMQRATLHTRLGRHMRARASRGGDALIGIPERALRDVGVRRVGRLERDRGGLPVCGDVTLAPSVVVWCTGFAPDHSWIDLPVFDRDGRPRHVRGEVPEQPGLHFVGQRFQHRQTSSLIGGVGADAEHVARAVARRCEAALPV